MGAAPSQTCHLGLGHAVGLGFGALTPQQQHSLHEGGSNESDLQGSPTSRLSTYSQLALAQLVPISAVGSSPPGCWPYRCCCSAGGRKCSA